jgi:homocysteine S-methyltransferase
MELLEELQAHVLCGDGAMGTMLLAGGIRLEQCFEELCVSEPERIGEIHRQYVAAGARVLKTNTFGANAVRLERFGLQGRVLEINRAAAQIAMKAAETKGVYVAGSVGPLGITGKEAAARGIDPAKCFREQLSALREGEVDLVVFETFMDVEEMEIALREWTESGGGPALCSFACTREGRISSGILLEDAFAKMRALGAQIVGVNCMNEPRGTVELLRGVPAEGLLAGYPSAGVPKEEEGRLIYQSTPEDLAQSAHEMVRQGVRLIGGCCGTTPAHIAALSSAIGELQRPGR